MMQICLCVIFFLNISLFSNIVLASEQQQNAKTLITRVKMYNYALEAIRTISSSSADTVEKDLSLCLVVGNASDETGNVAIASWSLRDKISDEIDREELDSLGSKQVSIRGAMQRFCTTSDPREYRDHTILLNKVSETDTILSKLKTLAEKYL
jgi:hypothetical protein